MALQRAEAGLEEAKRRFDAILLSGCAFVFRNRKGTAVKVLVDDGSTV